MVNALAAILALGVCPVSAFVGPTGIPRVLPSSKISPTAHFSSTKEKEDTATKSKSVNGAPEDAVPIVDPDAEGLPWWWELVWKLDMMQKGEQGEPVGFGDSANVLRTNIEQIYGGYPSLDGCPIAEGEITDIADGTMFIGLQRYQDKYESPYKLCFGPKSFLVISDPVQARHLLRDANTNYDKVGISTSRYWYATLLRLLTLGLSFVSHLVSSYRSLISGSSCRDFGANYGKRTNSSRPRNMECPSSTDCSCISQGRALIS